MPRLNLRDARIRTKLAVVLLIPVISTLVLGGVNLFQAGQQAAAARLSNHLTTLSAQVTSLAYALHHERMAVAEYLAHPSDDGAQLRARLADTDERITAFRQAREALGTPPDELGPGLDRIGTHLDGLGSIREEAQSRKDTSAAQMVLRYGVILADLNTYVSDAAEFVGKIVDVVDQPRAVAAFAMTQSAAADQQASAYVVLLSGGAVSDEQHASFVASMTTAQESLKEFLKDASEQQWTVVRNFVSGDAVTLADWAAFQVSRSTGTRAWIGAEDASRSLGAVVDLMRFAQLRLESQLNSEIQTRTDAVTRQVIAEWILHPALLLAAILIAALVARMMVRSLERLRGGALAVADHSLPAMVERLRDIRGLDERTAETFANEVHDEIRVPGRDEIGQVAAAFNIVHREAVRIAAEQAVLRATVSAMFLSLARRSQTLVDRMIAELDAIEQHEQDPARLARMFRLDHLATRMRRNDENLLVLAGADASPGRREDAGLEDVLRAAQSEVELYDRVEFSTVDGDTGIAAHAVNDVVRMVAELMDNGTRFSPPGTVVVADARRIGDYVLIQVEDRGLGMTDDQIHAVNERLAAPGQVDVSAFRMMGLGVVGRLADRYGIKAELRRNTDSGITAGLVLPRNILVLPRADVSLRPRRHLALEEGRHQALPSGAGVPAGRPLLPTRVPGQHVAGEYEVPVPVSAVPVSTVPVSAPLAAPAVDDTTELPIFRQMQASWFGSSAEPESESDSWGTRRTIEAPAIPAKGRAAVQQNTVRSDWPIAGAQPVTPGQPATAARLDGAAEDAGIPRQRQAAEANPEWQTSADLGWQAAAAASSPVTGSTTRSGLPIRRPQENLVPGSVGEPTVARVKRTPEQVQGLLSAYTRGVQRGRDDLSGPQVPVQNEENR